MSVSLDEEKFRGKWMDFIAEHELGGVQLLANGWSQITASYHIKAIPRFILVDKQGNIVSSNSPRPSDPALRELPDKELAK